MSLGIITEYNPLHNGHIYHLNKSKEITGRQKTICVMSGDFVQRGETSLLNKYIRTKMALQSGIDIVLMLPVCFSCQSSERFAFGSIKTLEKTNIVDCFSFGSEIGHIDILKKYADFLNNPSHEYTENLKKNLQAGLSYPSAREKSLKLFFHDNVLKNPNNILGIDYLRFNEKLKPYTFKRMGSDYHSMDFNTDMPSATAIRQAIKSDAHIPEGMPKYVQDMIFKNRNSFSNYDRLSQIFHYILFTKSKENLLKIVDLNEELLNRIIEVSKRNFLISDIAINTKCKNYTFTRIKRVINNIILNITNVQNDIKYIRVLGFKKESSHLISDLCKKADVPVIVNVKDYKTKLEAEGIQMFEKDLLAWDIFNLTVDYKYKSEFKNGIIKI